MNTSHLKKRIFFDGIKLQDLITTPGCIYVMIMLLQQFVCFYGSQKKLAEGNMVMIISFPN